MLGVKLGNAQTAGEAVTPEDDEDIGEELPANKAAKYYAGNVNSLRVRFRYPSSPCWPCCGYRSACPPSARWAAT